ncbi:Alkaline phosphatase synthesis sensor protein PhoR [compost metagenome]
MQLKAKEKNLSILFESKEAPSVYADGLRMEQVILNILENAVRYTEEGAIRARFQNKPKITQLIIEDTGMGIPADELPYIFDRFYRVEKSRSREFGGTGLGLAIVRKLVELQGGTIDVYSELGVGTRFVLSFPATITFLEQEKKA